MVAKDTVSAGVGAHAPHLVQLLAVTAETPGVLSGPQGVIGRRTQRVDQLKRHLSRRCSLLLYAAAALYSHSGGIEEGQYIIN